MLGVEPRREGVQRKQRQAHLVVLADVAHLGRGVDPDAVLGDVLGDEDRPAADVAVDAAVGHQVGGLRRQQQVVDADAVVALVGPALVVPEGVVPRRVGLRAQRVGEAHVHDPAQRQGTLPCRQFRREHLLGMKQQRFEPVGPDADTDTMQVVCRLGRRCRLGLRNGRGRFAARKGGKRLPEMIDL